MADIATYFWALASHWAAFVTGGIPAALFLVIERVLQRPFSLRTFVAVFLVFGFVAASYEAWHDEYQRNSSASILHQAHIAKLKQFYDEGGELLNRQIPKTISKADFDKYVADVDAWGNNSAKWIGENMGQPAENKFLDRNGIQAGFYSNAINHDHNNVIESIVRLRSNLDELITKPAWDNLPN